MLKIPVTTVASALQPTKGRVDTVLRRFLAPTVSHLEASVSGGNNNGRYSYHSQAFPQQSSAASSEKQMALPPNLMFDFKSSFAPQKEENTEIASSMVVESDDNVDNDDEQSESSEYDLDDEHTDEDIDETLFFQTNPTNPSTHRPVQPLPFRLQVPIHDCQSEEAIGSVWLDASVFGVEEIRVDLIAQNVNYIRNKIRGVRKAKSKTISEKSGSGRKVRNQKGGGIARAGHSRPAHWKGGAKAHGPKNTKDYGNTKLNKRVKVLAMRSMLSQKLKEGNLVVVNNLHLDSHKTGPWASILESKFGVGKALKKTRLRNNPELERTTSALVLDHYLEPEEEGEEDYHASYHGVPINLWVASSNIPRVTVRNHRFLNVYDCLRNEKLIVTLSALEQIEEKWKE